MFNKITFSQSDLDALIDKNSGDLCELGLLQATPSILSSGRMVYYTFIHLSIQEMLSVVYISRMSASMQISTFDSLFSDSRFGAVFQFYAAITKLRTSRSFLSKLPRRLRLVPAGVLDLVTKIIKKQRDIDSGRPKPLLVSLFHCFYEARDLSLCQLLVEQLGNELNLFSNLLTQVDSLAIGYFLCCVTTLISNNNQFTVNLSSCSLGDAGTKSLMRSICNSIDPHSTVNTYLKVNLSINEIREEGGPHIADVLNNLNIVSKLRLSRNPIGDKGLQNMFSAIKENKTLKELSIYHCDMTDAGVASLTEALHTNNTLERLDIDANEAITENGLTCLIKSLSKNSGLKELYIPKHLGVDELRKVINEERKRNGLPEIKVN